jgi:acyl carrier protein
MDFLSFVVGLHKALGVEVPEADYHELATLAGTVAYLEARAASRS